MDKNNKAFGCTLRHFRNERGLTQEALAFLCNLDRTYISLLELGQHSPTLNTLLAICQACGISLTDLANRIETDIQEGVDDASA